MIPRDEFARCLAILAAGIGKPINQEMAEVWYRLLGDIPAKSLKAAFSRAVLESEYPVIPPVGRIRRMAFEFIDGLPASPEEAFARIHDAVSRFGYPEPAKAREFLGAAIWRVVQGIGGWERICDSPIDQRQSLFAQFRDAWQRHADRSETLRRLPESIRPSIRVEEPAGAADPPRALPAVRLLAGSMAADRDALAAKRQERLSTPPPAAPPPLSRDEQIAALQKWAAEQGGTGDKKSPAEHADEEGAA